MKDFEEWNKRYRNKEVIHIKSHLDSNDLEILNKLGITIEDKMYTCYEFDVIDGDLILYYLDDEMTEEEKNESKPLEGTGVTRAEYNWVLKKFEIMQSTIKYDE